MSIKPKVWCSRCRTTHSDRSECPFHKPFERKRAGNQSGRGGRAWRRLRETVFYRDKFLCQIHLCRGELVPVALHGPNHGVCDHIVPVSQGGTDDIDNLQTICQACDKEKTKQEAKQVHKVG